MTSFLDVTCVNPNTAAPGNKSLNKSQHIPLRSIQPNNYLHPREMLQPELRLVLIAKSLAPIITTFLHTNKAGTDLRISSEDDRLRHINRGART